MTDRKNLLKALLEEVYSRRKLGSLATLRKVLGKSRFAKDPLAQEMVAYAHLLGFNLDFSNILPAIELFRKLDDRRLLAEIDRLLDFYKLDYSARPLDVTRVPFSDRQSVPRRFTQYCKAHGISIVRILQRGCDDEHQSSWVYLVWDRDNLFKVYKEVIDFNEGFPTRFLAAEGEVYSLLPPNPFYPDCYETVDIDDTLQFIRMSFQPGRSLGTLVDSGTVLAPNEACLITLQVAKALRVAHAVGVAHFDFRPHQVLLDPLSPEFVRVLDLGTARKVGNTSVDVYVTHTDYCAPETGIYHKGSKASDIFQLGVLFHRLLTGVHPFEMLSELPSLPREGEDALVRHFLPAVFDLYDSDLARRFGDSRLRVLAPMLSANPAKRPAVDQVIGSLSGTPRKVFSLGGKFPAKNCARKKNTVLFPGRMTIPHKGYVDYIRRLLDMGFFVHISFQCAYTLTKDDPIQKSFSMRMLARSLQRLGYVAGVDFDFIFTSFFEKRRELQDHFRRLEDIRHVVALASGNPVMAEVLPEYLWANQESVFGTEGASWEVRSWGSILRNAIRCGDYATFCKYAASGVEDVLTFRELQAMFKTEPFVPDPLQVNVALREGGRLTVEEEILTYASPEKSLAVLLGKDGRKAKILDPYAKNVQVSLDGKNGELVYVETLYDEDKRIETIVFRFMPD